MIRFFRQFRYHLFDFLKLFANQFKKLLILKLHINLFICKESYTWGKKVNFNPTQIKLRIFDSSSADLVFYANETCAIAYRGHFGRAAANHDYELLLKNRQFSILQYD